MRLSDFELDVMQIFWETGSLSAPFVHQAITQNKDVAYTTVKTIIDRLEDKGALKRTRREGRVIFYQATVEREFISKSLLPKFIGRLFGGDYSALITQIIVDKKLSDEELKLLESVIRDEKNKNNVG